MHGTGIAFGERVVLLEGGPDALPARVLVPGSGSTVADRAERAVDPVAEQRRINAAAELGVPLYQQCEVDIATADRLCPPTDGECRRAQAVLDLGVWRYRLEHCPPGPRMASLLEERPTDAAPAPGAGRVVGGTISLPGRRPGTFSRSHSGDGASGGGADLGGDTGSGDQIVQVISTDPDLASAPFDSDIWPRTVVATIKARQRLISHLQARQYADIAELSASYRDIHQFLTTELGLALTLTDSDAAGLLATAEALRHRLPGTAAALSDGRIDDAKATAIVGATACCTPEVAHQVEESVLPDAQRLTATSVRRRARRAVIAADPDGAADRHRKAVSERHVWRAPDADGMARLGLYASAQDVDTVWRAITAVADAIKKPGDTRNLGERRSDAMVMICTDILAAGGWEGLRLPDRGLARPRVTVTVPYTVLLGHRAPCELAGHGPICTEQALALIGGGDLYRMVCDPESGMLLDYGHTRYRPPPHLAEFVRLRDGECPLPTCHHPAERGQLDHIVPARPDPVTGKPTLGTTSANNLGPPCAHHHLGKDAGRGFGLHRDKDGTYTWTTPLGLVYSWRPDPLWHHDTDAIPGSMLRSPSTPAGAEPSMPAEVEAEVPACDCPDSCPCQHAFPVTGSDRLVPLTIDGDWADGFASRMNPPAPAEADGAAPDDGATADNGPAAIPDATRAAYATGAPDSTWASGSTRASGGGAIPDATQASGGGAIPDATRATATDSVSPGGPPPF